MGRYIILTAVLLLCILSGAVAQTSTISRLRRQVYAATNDENKLQAIFSLCEQRQSLSTDSLLKYAQEAKRLSLLKHNTLNVALADYYLVNCQVVTGSLDSAILLCNENLVKLADSKPGLPTWFKFSALTAQAYVKNNQFKDGIEQYYQLLKVAEKNNDTVNMMLAKNGIGWVNMEMNQNDQALKWFRQALNTSANEVHHVKSANIYSNIAAIYLAFKQYDSAEQYVKRSIEYSRKNDNLLFQANGLNILADIYINSKRAFLAEALLNEAIQIRKQIGDPFYIVSDISQLALFYAHNAQPQKGINLSLQGIEIAKKFGLSSKLPFLYYALAQNFKASGNYLKYGETMESVSVLKDSVYVANSAEAMAEMEARYNAQEQENIIIQQKLDIVSANYQLYSSLIVLFFGMVISYLVFRDYRRKQKAIVIAMREEEKRKAREAVLCAEENERKRIAADLHDNMGAYATAISANIDDLMLKENVAEFDVLENIKNNANDIMLNLRDTIWVLNNTSILLTGISDRFKNFIKKVNRSYPNITVDIHENIINNISLSPEGALNTLRIMQEALHNAIKHSNGDHILVQISSNENLEINIADNGSGIINSGDSNKGYGIENMQKRAEANGWKLIIKNVVAGGTLVQLRA